MTHHDKLIGETRMMIDDLPGRTTTWFFSEETDDDLPGKNNGKLIRERWMTTYLVRTTAS